MKEKIIKMKRQPGKGHEGVLGRVSERACGGGGGCNLSLCFHTARCLVCIMDLCSNSHIYLCSHLNVAAKHKLLKGKKIKERGRQSNAGITVSVDEVRFLLCMQNISLFSMQSSQRELALQCILMEISEVQRHGKRKNFDLW